MYLGYLKRRIELWKMCERVCFLLRESELLTPGKLSK